MNPDQGQTSRGSGTDTFPRPDPTKLTTEQLLRENASLKEVVFTRLDGMDKAITLFNENITRVPTETDKQIAHLKALLEGRFDGMDRANNILQAIADTLPEQVAEKISALKLFHEEKFTSIQTQFRERDVRTEQSSKDSKVAVDAALQAAKEAVNAQQLSNSIAISKSETATLKQIDQLGLLLQTGNKSIDDKYGELKERLNRLEGKSDAKANFGVIAAVIGTVGTIVAIVVSLVIVLSRAHG